MSINKLEWDDKYSVGVGEIDNQHKTMFDAINNLIDLIEEGDSSKLKEVIEDLVKYKIVHFQTEEKYFNEFDYDRKDEHIAKHKEFNLKLEEIKSKYDGYSLEFAFDLVDFLEDWLIGHLMGMDQKYVKCFKDHGLK